MVQFGGGRRRRRFRRCRARSAGLLRIGFGALIIAGAFFMGSHIDEAGLPIQTEFPASSSDDTVTDFSGRVTRIVDGDTFWMDGAPARVRIWGLDAPEKNEVGYSAASDALERIAGGRLVNCKTIDHDRYGRIVARCYLSSGDDVAELMIESGTASEYTYFSKGYYRRGRFKRVRAP